MAKLVLGFGTSHSPTIMAPPDMWTELAAKDAVDERIPFARLKAARESWIMPELTPERLQEKHEANLKGVAELADALAEARPDVVVLVGDDQHEVLWEDNYPPVSIYWGDEIPIVAARDSKFVGQSAVAGLAALSYHPEETTTYKGHPELGRYLVESLVAQEFDVGHIRRLSKEHGEQGIGHAWNFVWKNVMSKHRPPMVPLLLNTCYAPNRPTVKRCYDLGRAVRRAIEDWDTDLRVAIGASGGLTHQVVEEDLDRLMIKAFQEHDAATLIGIPEDRFEMDGTSESKNWVVVAGACEHMEMHLIDYVPCYRTVAGTGVGMGYATWG